MRKKSSKIEIVMVLNIINPLIPERKPLANIAFILVEGKKYCGNKRMKCCIFSITRKFCGRIFLHNFPELEKDAGKCEKRGNEGEMRICDENAGVIIFYGKYAVDFGGKYVKMSRNYAKKKWGNAKKRGWGGHDYAERSGKKPHYPPFEFLGRGGFCFWNKICHVPFATTKKNSRSKITGHGCVFQEQNFESGLYYLRSYILSSF